MSHMARVFKKNSRQANVLVFLCAILVLEQFGVCRGEAYKSRDWELAVAVGNRIEFFEADGKPIGATVRQFTRLKALAFDSVRHKFIVSETEGQNDTIYTVALSKDITMEPIVQELPDNVQGLAVDPIDDILFWTDTENDKGINFIRLNDEAYEPEKFLNSTDKTPQDLTIDVCRRYIYWTNSEHSNPSIERSFLNGSNHQVLINEDITSPFAITIDYKEQRLYWTDIREGVYYRIESSDLDGTNRKTISENTHITPYGIAVDSTHIYWTDGHNNALWRMRKDSGNREGPEKVRDFGQDQPWGLIAKEAHISGYPECRLLEDAILMNEQRDEVYVKDEEVVEGVQCLNGGVMAENQCKCSRGFSGRLCEVRVCHNFCFQGDCRISSQGLPQCHCPRGFGGPRCEKEMCKEYCLNGGTCSYERGDVLARCSCPVGFAGSRCEVGASFEDVCALYCKDREDEDILVSKENDRMCRCTSGTYVMVRSNASFALPLSQSSPLTQGDYRDFLEQNAVALVFAAVSLVSLVTLIAYVCAHRRRKRPRVHKRYIVNKNRMPLNNRPQPAPDQCEITIENCCNMNVCETPCFEPPLLRGFQTKKEEDKNKLLPNDEEDY